MSPVMKEPPIIVLEAYDFIEKMFCTERLYKENSMKPEALMAVLNRLYEKGKTDSK